MINTAIKQGYTATIGIECHVQLKTKTKLFAAVNNDAREADPNTLVSHICFGMPGALPVLNEAAIHLAVRAAFALGAEPERYSKFDRKHYFYPDLPLGYQITQFDEPIIRNGFIDITIDNEQRRIRVERAHLEADAGKSTHPSGADYSLVDLNRVGTPLLEIVSAPDIHTPAEAKAYAHELYLRMKFADVSDANLYYGNMRFDINVSVSKNDELGIRTETKNINSFRAVEKVVDYEINRQIEVLENGGNIVQETRGWDDAKQKTFSQRTKEDAHDYRYFPDPDLPPVVLDEQFVATIRSEMPIMPNEWRTRLNNIGLDSAQIESLLDAEVEFESTSFLPILESQSDNIPLAKMTANWAVNIVLPILRDGLVQLPSEHHQVMYEGVFDLVHSGKLSSTNAKQLLSDIAMLDILPADIAAFASEKGYIQVSDELEIATIVSAVVADNPQAANDVQNGEMKAIGFLVGQVMKQSKGKANPQLAQKLIKEQLGV